MKSKTELAIKYATLKIYNINTPKNFTIRVNEDMRAAFIAGYDKAIEQVLELLESEETEREIFAPKRMRRFIIEKLKVNE